MGKIWIRLSGLEVQIMSLKDRLDSSSSGEGWVCRVMGLSGCGVLRIRAVTMM